MDAQTRDAPSVASPKNSPRKAVLERFDLSPSGLHKNLKLGRFPQPFHVGGKPLWREADLQAVEAGRWTPETKVEEPKQDTAARQRHRGRPRQEAHIEAA